MTIIKNSDMEAAHEFYSKLSDKTQKDLWNILDICRSNTDIVYGYILAVADREIMVLIDARGLALTLCSSQFINSITN